MAAICTPIRPSENKREKNAQSETNRLQLDVAKTIKLGNISRERERM
jgi:hypothetical protein